MIHDQILTRLREETFLSDTGTVGHLLIAGRSTEFCRRSTHIVDVTLKIGILRHHFRFIHNRLMTSRLHDSSFMHGEGAKVTFSITSSVTCQRKFDLGQSRNSTGRLIHRMVLSCVRKCIDIIHFQLGKRLRRRILNNEGFAAVALVDSLCRKRIRILVLDGKTLCIGFLIRNDFFKVRKTDGIVNALLLFGLVNRSLNVGNIRHINTGSKSICNLHDALFSHAVGDDIRSRLQQNGTTDRVGPIVVMSHSSKGCLYSTDDDWCLLIEMTDEVTIDGNRTIRPLSCLSSRRICILMAPLFIHGVVIDHGIHITGRNQKAKTRLTKHINTPVILPVRLTDHSNRISVCPEHPTDDGRAKARMVHIGVSADVDKVHLRKASLLHFFFRYRHKSFCH